MYYRNAQAALVVYDVTKAASFIKARHWVKELHQQASPGIVIALVGNKLDLCSEDSVESDGDNNEATGETENSRKVAIEEGKQLADEEGLLFFETSAKNGYNVNEVFMSIAAKIPENVKNDRGRTQGESGRLSNDGRIDLTTPTNDGSSSAGCSC